MRISWRCSTATVDLSTTTATTLSARHLSWCSSKIENSLSGLQGARDTGRPVLKVPARGADAPVNRAGPHREERTRRLRRELGGETRKRAWMAGQGVKPLNRLPSAGISSVSTWPQRWPRLGSAAQHPTMLETCKTCGRSWRMKDTRCGVTAVDVAAQPRFHQQLKW